MLTAEDMKDILNAAESGNLNDEYLNKIHQKNAEGLTPLHCAIKQQRSLAVRALIKAKVDLGCQDKDGKTPLHLAAEMGSSSSLHWLLEAGASPNVLDNDGNSPLMQVLSSPFLENNPNLIFSIVNALLSAKADPNILNKKGQSAFELAIENGLIDVILQLRDNKAVVNINAQDENGNTLLMRILSNLNIVQTPALPILLNFLMSEEVDTTTQNKQGRTAVAMAVDLVIKGKISLTTLMPLLLYKNTMNVPLNKEGTTVLMKILTDNYWDDQRFSRFAESAAGKAMITTLLSANPDLNVQNVAGQTVLHIMANEVDMDLLPLFLEKKVALDIPDNEGNTPLMLAIYNFSLKVSLQHIPFINLFLEAGANPNLQNNKGQTALYLAVLRGLLEVIPLLKEKKADPNIADHSKETPLLAAMRVYGKSSVKENAALLTSFVSALLEMGANPNVGKERSNFYNSSLYSKNKVNETPFDLALKHNYIEIIELLMKAGARLDFLDQFGNNFLLQFIFIVSITNRFIEKDLALATRLIDLILKQININAVNNLGETALHIAAENGLVNLTRLLTERKADANIINKYGQNPLMQALERARLLPFERRAVLISITKILLSANVKIDTRDEYNRTALNYAALNGLYEVMDILVKKGADKEIADSDNNTVCHNVVLLPEPKKFEEELNKLHRKLQQLSCLAFLRVAKADMQKKGHNNNTLLHSAASHGFSEALLPLICLVEQNSEIINKQNKTALQLAIEGRHQETATILRVIPSILKNLDLESFETTALACGLRHFSNNKDSNFLFNKLEGLYELFSEMMKESETNKFLKGGENAVYDAVSAIRPALNISRQLMKDILWKTLPYFGMMLPSQYIRWNPELAEPYLRVLFFNFKLHKGTKDNPDPTWPTAIASMIVSYALPAVNFTLDLKRLQMLIAQLSEEKRRDSRIDEPTHLVTLTFAFNKITAPNGNVSRAIAAPVSNNSAAAAASL